MFMYLAKEEEVIAVIRHLGTQSVRSKRLILLSRAYLQDPPSIYDLRSSKANKMSSPSTLRTTAVYPATPISHLPGTGRYALDSYRIFCTQKHDFNSEEWKSVLPTDKELIRYLVSQGCFPRFWYLLASVATEMEVGLL